MHVISNSLVELKYRDLKGCDGWQIRCHHHLTDKRYRSHCSRYHHRSKLDSPVNMSRSHPRWTWNDTYELTVKKVVIINSPSRMQFTLQFEFMSCRVVLHSHRFAPSDIQSRNLEIQNGMRNKSTGIEVTMTLADGVAVTCSLNLLRFAP